MRSARSLRGSRWALLLALVLALLGAPLAGCASDAGPTKSSATDAALGANAPAGCPAPNPAAPGAKESRLPVRSMCALPKEAGTVWQKIKTGARLQFPKDGGTFNNAERLLPRHEQGYYREYTVPTPGSKDRGARRLVTGSGQEVYYTGDHYQSFVVVDSAAVSTG
jgi:ribonuclease T1